MGSAAHAPRFLTVGGRLLLTLVVVAVLVLGIWLAGGVLTNDFTASLVLTAAWMGAAGLACLVLALRRRELRLPLLGAYALVAIAATIWLGRAEFFDKTVHENVVKARPPSSRSRDTSTTPARNVLVSRGSFESLEHESSGVASLIRTRNGKSVLTLTDSAPRTALTCASTWRPVRWPTPATSTTSPTSGRSRETRATSSTS